MPSPSLPVSGTPYFDGLLSTVAPSRPLIAFWAPGDPPKTTAQQKGVFIVNGKPRFFTKGKVRGATTLLEQRFSLHRPAVPLDQALAVRIRMVYPWPKSARKRDRETTQPHQGAHPDVDNAYKLIGDVLTHLGFWRDDGLVSDLHVSKWRGPKPGIGVRISPAVPWLPDYCD